tara:strand:- start:668 stop:1801 length:1134 start_codon:yes stop_codon:yes gene_type:complete
MKEKILKYCKSCLMPNSRPRITFDNNGECNACTYNKKKINKIINWNKRWEKLEELCEFHRNRNKGRHNVIVPYSGGKDGAYIAYTLKNKLKMNPLCITIRPPLEEEIGKQNIYNFMDRGYDHIFITPNRIIEKEIDKENFVNRGIPMHAFMILVQTAIARAAVDFDIPFVMFAEEGESEYGGSSKLEDQYFYEFEDGINFYLSGVNPDIYLKKYSKEDLYWFTYPSKSEMLKRCKPLLCHWSYFENFVNYDHYVLAKEKLGLIEKEQRNSGAIENFSSTDTYLIRLYFYLMYLKFGFGRVTSEVSNEIRRGSMTRNQALNIVKALDGEIPDKETIEKYLDYYQISKEKFEEILDKHANKSLFYKNNNSVWTKKFEIY